MSVNELCDYKSNVNSEGFGVKPTFAKETNTKFSS